MRRAVYILLVLFALANVAVAQNRDADNILNAQFNARIGGVAPKGSKILEMRVRCRNINEAEERAKRDAVAVCLLRGLPASTKHRPSPAIVKESVIESNEAFFVDFLEIPKSKKLVGRYAKFINCSEIVDYQEVPNGVDAVVSVHVLYDNLLNYMKDKGFATDVSETMAGKYLKPVIMVVPSDVYCTEMDFVQTWTDGTGKKQTILSCCFR